MKRTLLIVAMLLIAAPAMAVRTVSVRARQGGTPCSTVEVNYVCSGDANVRAFALDISVDNGCKIKAIRDFNRGVSTTKAPCIRGYGIFPGKFRDCPINPVDPCWADPNYNPISGNETDTGGTGLDTNKVIVELGALYSLDANSPTSSGVLFKLDVIPPHPAMDCNLFLALNSTRGGVVDINGDSFVKDTNLTLVGNGTKVSFPDNYPCWQPYTTRYTDWVSMAKPPCWCPNTFGGNGYQCDGDVDGIKSSLGYRVYSGDQLIVASCWKMKYNNPLLNPCADVDHAKSSLGYRVYSGDQTIIANNWKKKDSALPADCPKP
jgi:hypothetical protein